MIFQPSCFILYFIFPMNLFFFYVLFYNDVTTLLFFDRSQWKLHSMCKIENKKHFVCENLLIFGIFIEKITINYENHVNCPVNQHLPPSPLGRPLGWVLLGTHLWHTWGYFFNTKNKKNNNSFYLNWWKPGTITIIPLPFGPPLGRPNIIPLIFWDASPPYLRMLFQHFFFFATLTKILGRSP